MSDLRSSVRLVEGALRVLPRRRPGWVAQSASLRTLVEHVPALIDAHRRQAVTIATLQARIRALEARGEAGDRLVHSARERT